MEGLEQAFTKDYLKGYHTDVCETFVTNTGNKHLGLWRLEIDVSLPVQFSRRICMHRQFLMMLASEFLKKY